MVRKAVSRPGGSYVNPNAIVNTPQFPGLQKGQTMKQVQDWNKNQVRRKGFRFSGGTTAQDFRIQIAGTARYLYGIAFLNPNFGIFSFKVNNEEVITQLDTGFAQFGTTEQDYFAVNRPLSGSDDIVLSITGDAGYQNQPFVVIYK